MTSVSVVSPKVLREGLHCARWFVLQSAQTIAPESVLDGSPFGLGWARFLARLPKAFLTPPAERELPPWWTELMKDTLRATPELLHSPALCESLVLAARSWAADTSSWLSVLETDRDLALSAWIRAASRPLQVQLMLPSGRGLTVSGPSTVLTVPGSKQGLVLETLPSDGSSALQNALLGRQILRRQQPGVQLRTLHITPSELTVCSEQAPEPELNSALEALLSAPEQATPKSANAAVCVNCPAHTACRARWPVATPGRDTWGSRPWTLGLQKRLRSLRDSPGF